MRALTDADKLRALMDALGRGARGPGRVYFVGGATAVLLGWRRTTIDADLKLDPEPPGVFEAIARVKETLDMNVELAAPDDFIPAVPGWRERSRFIARVGEVDFYHYDLVAQCLAKIERGHAKDVADVRRMLADGLVEIGALRDAFDAIADALLRYPAIDPAAFRARLERIIAERRDG